MSALARQHRLAEQLAEALTGVHEQHAQHHVAVLDSCRDDVAALRLRLLVDPAWQFDVKVVCPDELEHAVGWCRWGYVPNGTFELGFRCDLSPEERRWAVAHELFEAVMAPYAELVSPLIGAKRNRELRLLLEDQHSEIRDALIERVLCVIFGSERPSRLPGTVGIAHE